MKYKIKLLKEKTLLEANFAQIKTLILNRDSITQEKLNALGATIIRDKEGNDRSFQSPLELLTTLIDEGFLPLETKVGNTKQKTDLGQRVYSIMKSKKTSDINEALSIYINGSEKLKMILNHYVRDSIPTKDVEDAVKKRPDTDKSWSWKDVANDAKKREYNQENS